jgi:FkbM family methyltransferase
LSSFKLIIYKIIFPIIKGIIIFLFSLKKTRMCSAIYSSLRHVQGLRYFCIDTDKETFLVNLNDQEIAKSLFCTGLFDFEKLLISINIIKTNNKNYESNTLVDIGANIGTISIPAIKRGVFEKVVAFEPNAENSKLLKVNLILNNIDDKFKVHQSAVGDKDAYLDMELSSDNSGDHRISVSDSNGIFDESNRKKIQVKSVKLDSVLTELNPLTTLIWIDVQGYEGHVLTGAKNILKNKTPLVIEFWPYGLNRTSGLPLLISSLSQYKGFYDLASPGEFHDINELNLYYNKIGLDGKFVDLLVL